MAATSSISSFKKPDHCGVPWALLLAVGLLAIVELALHRIPATDMVYYGDDADQRTAVRDRIELGVSPDVVLVGSSQMRQAVVMPAFIPKARAMLGRTLSVGNYALRGGKLDVMNYMIRDLCTGPRRPKVIVLGVSVRDLRGYEPDWDAIAPFSRWSDVRAEYKRHGLNALGMVSPIIRDRVFGWYRTLRYRNYLGYLIKTQFVDVRDEGDIAAGDVARELTYLTRSLDSSPMSQTTLKRRMKWSFDVDHPAKSSPMMVDYLNDIATTCKKHGVRLLVIEVPISGVMEKALPRKFYSEFQKTMVAFHKATKVPYLSSTELIPHYSNAQWFDAQHLNYRGAMLFGPKLAEMLPLAK